MRIEAAELWIVNLQEDVLLVCRDPSGKKYKTALTLQRDDLRNVGYGVFREPTRPLRQEDVPRCIGPFHVACKRNANDCRYSTSVQRVTLDYNDRPPIARS